MPNEYRHELSNIEEQFSIIELQYDLDMSLNIGGEMITITKDTGLYLPWVSIKKHLAKGLIQMNSKEVLSASNPAKFMQMTIHDAIAKLLDHIEAKDKVFDKALELKKLAVMLST